MSISYEKAAQAIIAAGRRLDARGFAPATSGNYSVRLDDGRIAVTVSGRHKGRLTEADIMIVDADGKALEPKKPSAETLLHASLYRLYPEAGAILHTHSTSCVALTRAYPERRSITLEGYEMLKAFPGISTHETRVEIPVFENSQDMNILADEVEDVLRETPETPAYLIRGHGLYAWGRDMDEAERVAEAMEYLLTCELEMLKLTRGEAA